MGERQITAAFRHESRRRAQNKRINRSEGDQRCEGIPDFRRARRHRADRSRARRRQWAPQQPYGSPYGNAYGYNNYGQIRSLQVRASTICSARSRLDQRNVA